MNYNTFILKNTVSSLMENEILFAVASARAQGKPFLKLEFDVRQGEKAEQCAAKILRALKKRGRIEFFVAAKELGGASTEAQYIRNKYPTISELLGETDALIVKL